MLLVGPLSDMIGSTKRSRVRGSLCGWSVRRPACRETCPRTSSRASSTPGRPSSPTPWVMLSSVAHLLVHWHDSPADVRDAVWDDPWAFRPRRGGTGRRPARRRAALRRRPPGLLHDRAAARGPRGDRHRARYGRDALTGDVEKDLKTITLRLQAEAGGAAVRYDQAPLLQAWSDDEGSAPGWSAARSTSRTGSPPGCGRGSCRSPSASLTQRPRSRPRSRWATWWMSTTGTSRW